ncbi:sirohydrochlorin ferrochelatase [Methylophilales bacterium MBRSG12]|uniref:Sirohydrochlorin ferrochelatase n=1 Tax=Methylophilales bacterium MBRS-H7 TaxID=1623450 RepID=A0A0H4IYP0_9PROT|nr:sirohydrochlorin ferrochelatase [Methylophilales bacterium MBRSF5]AKO66101.1 sirohydrochlorin ferrochelatase [Methylophilales bacterium MBRS-H7]AKO67420.1 sirohydrochlorin ferrochelatase [Methylophilales bacterium MBRSG12]
MKRFPLFVNLDKLPVLVVGGGDIAERKINLIIKANANVEVLARNFSHNVEQLISKKKLKKIKQSLDINSLGSNYSLIIAATDNKQINKKLFNFAKKNNILINVVDQPELCTCTFGSIVERGDLVIAISTGGSAPVFARNLREKFETLLPQSTKQLIDFSSSIREKVIRSFSQFNKRRIFWELFFDAFATKKNITKSNLTKLSNQLIKTLRNKKSGEVFLVGAGPGDPELLTLRALHLIQKADVCIYDNLVSKEILELVRRDAHMIYAGKLRNNHTIEQKEINKLLVNYAKKGLRVLRLKGGDPFMFGRGGEEISELMAKNIKFQVVPGITAATGVSAYAGIPLTHRDYSQSCIFITGHEKNGTLNINWDNLTQENQTIVIYMGLNALPIITQNLIDSGMRKNMPIALVQEGTTDNQKVVVSTISRVNSKILKTDIQSPVIIIIGEVVKLRKTMKWFN